MKPKTSLVIVLFIAFTISASLILFSTSLSTKSKTASLSCCDDRWESIQSKSYSDSAHEACVFKTVFEGEYRDSDFVHYTPENVKSSILKALSWIVEEQLPDGGWYGGFHAFQKKHSDPNAKADPATTAMVSMAILRCGSDPVQGPHSDRLNRATEFLLNAVETSTAENPNITTIKGTQPQIKLGQNIDVMLTSQYLTNLLIYYTDSSVQKNRIKKCVDKCVLKIQNAQHANGSFTGGGWAGVLQSSIANNALESAASSGITIDSTILEKSRSYQKGNYNAENGSVATGDGAGVVLYSISGSSRASAKEALYAKKVIQKAKKEGKIKNDTTVSKANLIKAGMSEDQALKYNTAYQINASSSKKAQTSQVMNGFGSNGGEEFFSFLQTGEGLIISRDKTWKEWYTNVSGKLVKIQGSDGYWQGHHCITSPVFCTATCLLILSVNNDMSRLLAMGQ